MDRTRTRPPTDGGAPAPGDPRAEVASGDRGAGTADGPAVGLAELVTRLLDRGVVVSGDVVIAVAGVDLVYLGLDVVLAAVETLRRSVEEGGAEDEAGSPKADDEVGGTDDGAAPGVGG